MDHIRGFAPSPDDETQSTVALFEAVSNCERVNMKAPRESRMAAGQRMPPTPTAPTPGMVSVTTVQPTIDAAPDTQSPMHTPPSSPTQPVQPLGPGSLMAVSAEEPSLFDTLLHRHSAQSVGVGVNGHAQIQQPVAASEPEHIIDMPPIPERPPSPPAPRWGVVHPRHHDEKPSNTTACSTYEDELMEKHAVLAELNQLQQQQGVYLSRSYSTQDSLDDLQFEVRRHLVGIDEVNMVRFMSDGMRLACTGLELANSKMGPFLELDGWATEVTSDMTRYNSALTKLYRKYWQRSAMSPEMELVMALVGSVVMHHFKQKTKGMFSGIMGGGKDRARAPDSAADGGHMGPSAMPFVGATRPPPARTPQGPPVRPAAPPPADMESAPPPPAHMEGAPPPAFHVAHVPSSLPVSSRKRLNFAAP